MKAQFTLLTFLIFNFTLSTFNLFAQWQPDVRLTNAPNNSFTSYNNAWCVASSGDVVHIVWYDARDGNSEIYYKRSTDGGRSWGADTGLTNNPAYSAYPSIAVSGTTVHVVWFDDRDGNDEIYYKRSTDGGSSWGADTRLTNNSAGSMWPSVSASGLDVHVVWTDTRNGAFTPEIYYKRSTDGGISWGADTGLTNNHAISQYPSVSASDSVVHVVWDDNRVGNYEIYYKRSTDGGITWQANTRLTNDSAFSLYPSVSVSGQIVHVIWHDYRDGNYEIYYKRSTDGGISWSTDTRLTNDAAESINPSVSISGQVVHVVWTDSRDGNYELYYKRSTDEGISWGTDTRLTNDPGVSQFASISVSDTVVHVIWEDNRDGNYEIYYKRYPVLPPLAPVYLTATAVSSSRINLNWRDLSNNETGFKIERSTDTLISWILIDSVVQNTTVYADTGLTANMTYYYKIYAYNVAGNSFSNTAFATTFNTPPIAPSNLTALAVSSSRINLNWIDSSNNEAGFKIQRSTDAGANWILKDSVIQNVTAYADTGLTENTIYHYRIYAYNSGGNSPYSNIAFDTTFNILGGISNGEIPKEFKLYTNYPNPFNPATKIKFDLPKPSFTQLIVYDILGREIGMLVNKELKAGAYSVDWNASNYPSGVYFYRIQAGDFTDTKKMILMK